MPNTNDYPEHLNPFKKRLGIRGSFRELKRSLGRTFKRKDEETRPIEREQIKAVATRTRHSDSSIVTIRNNGADEHKTELYPRSRFSERVAKSYGVKNPFLENGKENGITDPESNPFEEIDSAVKADNNTESVKKYSKRYRRKKRAPQPPNKVGDSTLAVPSYNSDWSLSSYDTDCSSYYCSETEAETVEIKENLKDIAEISTEIINYCKQTAGSDDDLKNMPDLVVSAENDAKINNSECDTNVCSGKLDENFSDSVAVEDEVGINNTCDSKLPETLRDCEGAESCNEIAITNEEEILDICCETHNTEEVKREEDENDDQNNNSVLKNEVEISYVESKSLYIAGSKDDLDKVEEVSETTIYITGSRDELNDSLKENQPVPKIRKHKLSKAALLGSADEISDVDKL